MGGGEGGLKCKFPKTVLVERSPPQLISIQYSSDLPRHVGPSIMDRPQEIAAKKTPSCRGGSKRHLGGGEGGGGVKTFERFKPSPPPFLASHPRDIFAIDGFSGFW